MRFIESKSGPFSNEISRRNENKTQDSSVIHLRKQLYGNRQDAALKDTKLSNNRNGYDY